MQGSPDDVGPGCPARASLSACGTARISGVFTSACTNSSSDFPTTLYRNEGGRMTSLPTTPASNDAAALNLEEMPITQHLVVLRKHLFKVVAVLIGLFFCLLPFANQTYQ